MVSWTAVIRTSTYYKTLRAVHVDMLVPICAMFGVVVLAVRQYRLVKMFLLAVFLCIENACQVVDALTHFDCSKRFQYELQSSAPPEVCQYTGWNDPIFKEQGLQAC